MITLARICDIAIGIALELVLNSHISCKKFGDALLTFTVLNGLPESFRLTIYLLSPQEKTGWIRNAERTRNIKTLKMLTALLCYNAITLITIHGKYVS